MTNTQQTICLDFDGVVHMYTSGWKGADVIPDPPVPGAFEFINDCLDLDYRIAIFSARSHQEGGIPAMVQWFEKHANKEFIIPISLTQLFFPKEKPPATLYIDDRGFHFEGQFPTMEFIKNFKPWNKK